MKGFPHIRMTSWHAFLCSNDINERSERSTIQYRKDDHCSFSHNARFSWGSKSSITNIARMRAALWKAREKKTANSRVTPTKHNGLIVLPHEEKDGEFDESASTGFRVTASHSVWIRLYLSIPHDYPSEVSAELVLDRDPCWSSVVPSDKSCRSSSSARTVHPLISSDPSLGGYRCVSVLRSNNWRDTFYIVEYFLQHAVFGTNIRDWDQSVDRWRSLRSVTYAYRRVDTERWTYEWTNCNR